MEKFFRGIFPKFRKIFSKKVMFIFALILALAAGVKVYTVGERYYLVFDEIVPKAVKVNHYEIEVTFHEAEKILEGRERVTYTNNSNFDLKDVYFHIYPNVFKDEETVPFQREEMALAYRDGFEPGYIIISRVQVDKKDVNYFVMGNDNSILKVNLGKELMPGEDVIIDIDFTVKIPPASGRLGYGRNTVNLGNWYPILSVLDENGWNLKPYYPIGDPFFSDVANYRVIISMPYSYIIASTGDLVKKENIDGNYRWTFVADKVRDFAMVASTKFKVAEDKLGDISILSYYLDEMAAPLSLEVARDAIDIFSEAFGKYPYKHFSVAAADFFIGGMEYPKLVYIDEGLYGNKEILEYIIVHEAAHQWWYGVVGNNEIKEAWLDEALTEYSTMLYYEKKYGKKVKEEMYRKMILEGYNGYRNHNQRGDEVILKELGDFKNSREYQALVYCKGAMFLEALRQEMGNEDFFNSLKFYYDKYKYKNATTEDFIKVCEIVSDKDLSNFFKKWLLGSSEE